MTSQAANPHTAYKATQWTAAVGLVGAMLQVLGGVLETLDRVRPGEPSYELRTSAMGIVYLLLLGTLVALGRSSVLGRGRLPLIGLVTAGAGWVLSAVAQVVLQFDVDLAEKVLFPLATASVGVGMIVVGIVIIRIRRWHGWRRIIGLTCGLYPFVVLFPTFAATGSPNFLVLSGWGACWFALGLALWND
jgi:hypothetical protein